MSQQLPQIEIFTERKKLVAGREQTVDLLIRITPPICSPTLSRRPSLNLGLILDRSGSMSGEKIERARQACSYCIDQLLPTDRLSLVIFDDQIDVLVPGQLVENKLSLKGSLAGIQARNSTALHEAWVRGGLEVSARLLDDGINRVLLVTDGLANVGLTNTDEIVTQAMGLYQRGVSTSTIGIGADFNEDLLLPMAQSAGGNAWHVEQPDDMQRIFAVELNGLIAQVAHTVSLNLIPGDGVRLVDVLNDFELTETGRFRLPDLQAGSPLEIVVQLHVPAKMAGEKLRLLDLRLGFTPQQLKAAEVVKSCHEIEFAEQRDVERLASNNEVAKAVRILMNARARREAIRRMDAGDFAGAQAVVVGSLHATQVACAPMMSAPEVQQECGSLELLAASLTDRRQDKMNRKRLAYQAWSRLRGKG